MANKLLWVPESVVTLMSTELNNMANNATVVDGADYDNAGNKFRFADYLLHLADFDAAPDVDGFFELHLFYKLDGTLYGDGENGDVANVVPTGNSLHGIFHVAATDAIQVQQVLRVPLGPFAIRHALTNKCGQDLTAVDTHLLKICPYNEELQ